MSKLFETLEQIRRHEFTGTEKPVRIPPNPASPKNNRLMIILPSVVFVVVIITSFLLLPGLQEFLPTWTTAVFQKKNGTRNETSFTQQNNPPDVMTKADPRVVQKTPMPTKSDTQAKLREPAGLSEPIAAKNKNNFAALNNQGAEFIVMGRHWEGINLLNQAHHLQPGRIEPLLNMAVGLAELGLYSPATRYFLEAKKIDPDNTTLLKNMKILRQAGLFEMTM